MRALLRVGIVCASIAWTGVALAAPKPSAPKPGAAKVDARAKYKLATQLDDNGDYDKALVSIDEGLALAPQDLQLLGLKGNVLLKLRDYSGALAAYQTYLAANPTGANRREAEKIVKNLLAVQSTFLDLTLANGPADIYLDSKTLGVFCTAAPSCHKAILPGAYKVIAERAGFDRWSDRVTIEQGKSATLAVTLVEKPSLLTVRVAQPGAHVTVDNKAFDAPAPVAAGSHRVVVALAGHAEARLEATAHEGKPVELGVSLIPLVPIRVEPAGAQLVLDDKPIAVQDGSLAIPPGAHALVARARGFQDRRTDIPAERPSDYQLAITLDPVQVAATPPMAPSASDRSTFTGRRKVALAVGGVGIVAATGGVVLGLWSKQLDDDTYALCPSPSTPCRSAREANDLNQRGRSRALQANVAYGVAGGAVIGAAILWLTGAPESRVAVTPHVGAVAGLDLTGRF